MPEADTTIAVLGGGAAGAAALQRLRQLDYQGGVVLVTREQYMPYDRTALSKAYLRDGAAAPQILLASASRRERVLTGFEGNRLELGTRMLWAGDEPIRYDRLLLATGAAPRKLDVPGAALPGVHALRTLDDASQLASSLELCQQGVRALLVVGGGWIGLEVAAAARARGVDVVLAERGPRLCQRGAPASVSRYLEALHRRNGVRILLNAEVAAFEGREGVDAARFVDGRRLEVGAVVVGIGVLPELELAHHAGLKVGLGIAVDQRGRTSDAHVYAAGDAAQLGCDVTGVAIRHESWLSARLQGRYVAQEMLRDLGRTNLPPTTTPEASCFDSEQYGQVVRITGNPSLGHSCGCVVEDSDGFVETFYAGGSLVGVAAIGQAQVFRELHQKLKAQRLGAAPS